MKLEHFVNGRFTDAASGTIEIVNPSTAEVITKSPLAGPDVVDAAVKAAEAAFPAWSRTTPANRAAALFALAQAVELDIDRLLELEVTNAGLPITPYGGPYGLPWVVDVIRYSASAARMMEATVAGEYMDGHTSMVRREPLGVICCIAPWNDPLLLALTKVVPALAAGNTVILKPAPNTPLTAVGLAQLAADILPPGVLNVVLGGQETGEALLAHPGISGVGFTGSVETGRRIAEAAARTLKKTVLELGGKSPVIVFADSDIERISASISENGFFSAGQNCIAATRILVEESAHDELVHHLTKHAQALVMGDAMSADTTLGPLISARQRESVEGFLERRGSHVELAAGGSRPDGLPGFFLEPTIVVNLRADDEMAREEIFGPVQTVETFTDDAEAIQRANATRYGLGASVWTSDTGRALRFARDIKAGNVWVNTHMLLATELPFGGFKASGYGREFGGGSIEEFTGMKHVAVSLEV
jgi:betaine-aldehyde dehydrogenase